MGSWEKWLEGSFINITKDQHLKVKYEIMNMHLQNTHMAMLNTMYK